MANNQNPKRLALVTSISIIIVNTTIFIIFGMLFNQMGYLAYVLGGFTSLIFIYFIIFHTLETFIYKKVKLIYKTIHRLKRGKLIPDRELDLQVDILENVNQEFIDWAKMQKEEIQQMKDLEQYRRDFVGNVSHELKTPIFSIQGYVHTLLDGGINDDKINIKYLEKSAKSIDRMINMVEDLETISALESGMIEINSSKNNIVSLTMESIELLEEKSQRKNIKLFLAKGNKQDPILVFADKDRIRQVFINLIDNAIKYIGKASEPYIKISFYDMDENILVEVSDNGMGIAVENIPHLFDRFYRVDDARSRAQGGTGLGLSIVKHILTAHKQTINVRSTLGVGTTFSFTLKKV